MSKGGRNNSEEFRAFKAKMAKKRMGKEEATGSDSDMDYITVQQLSSNERNQPDRCQQELSPLFHLVLC